MNIPDLTRTTLVLALALPLFCLPGPVLAVDIFGGEDTPLENFTSFITGPFAYFMVIVGIVGVVATLLLGGEFTAFNRRMPLLVVAGAVVLLAGTVVSGIFGTSRPTGAGFPPGSTPAPWVEPEPAALPDHRDG